MRKNIIVMGGSFNPPTIAHQRLLLDAVSALGADQGIFIPSSNSYVKVKMRRANHPEETLPEQLRLRMLQAMAEDDSRLAVDDLEYHRKGKGYTYETMLSVQEKYPDATLYFLAGGDKIDIFPRWHRIREFLEHFHIIVVKRDGENPEAALEENEFLRLNRDKFHILDAPEGIENISSSVIRDKLRENLPGAEEMCHPKVWKLLQDNGGMGKLTIYSFRNEYRFLSNFWDAPVTYNGLTYLNNEAAFQAQKCLSDEEKLQFTALCSYDAKRLGRHVSLRPDWEQVKLPIMEDIVRAKFTQNEDLRQLLLATGDMTLEEGNTWNDTFWGVDVKTREGQNHLGRILMRVRTQLQDMEGMTDEASHSESSSGNP